MTKFKTSVQPEDMASDLNALQYIISKSIKDTVNTLVVVKVVKVNDGTIDVQTIIQDISSSDEAIGTYIIPNVRYMKWQYGLNCINATPEVGDIGILVISKQDTSGLGYLNSDGETICKTRRQFNIGSGIYIGGLYGMNSTPTQYIEFTSTGIKLKSTQQITVEAPIVNLGGENGAGVASIGKKVTTDGTEGGTVVGYIAEGSTKVKVV